MSETQDVIADLIEEGNGIDRMLNGLDASAWALPTPAPGWTVAHQIAHLTHIFHIAEAAVVDPERFKAMAARAADDFDGVVNAGLSAYVSESPETLLARWREQRAATADAIAAVPVGELIPWLVRPVPSFVLASVGIMEQFAHGQDIADALGVRRGSTERLKHVVGFAVLVRDFGYQARGLKPPAEEFRFEISGPSGEVWAFGPEDAAQRVTGPAYDFCLLVTRRRHRDDLTITAEGAEAERWLDIAQAYRGPAGPGRRPGQFPHEARVRHP